MYGMKRTTVYLTEEQKAALEGAAAHTHRSEADLIREGVEHVIREYRPPSRRPRVPLFSVHVPEWEPENLDRALDGFGED